MEVELTNSRVVAIDGGTATGKGRLIDELSQLLRLKGVPVIHLSTGSLYRAVAYAALGQVKGTLKGRRGKSEAELNKAALPGVRAMPAERLLELAHERHIEMHGGLVWIDGALASEDDQLKAPSVGIGSSIVAQLPLVRELVNTISRRQVNEFDGYVLIDGRDTTHTVVPDAPLKLLLTVTPEVAARRSHEHTIEEVIARDANDRGRPTGHGELRTADNPGDQVLVLPTDDHSPESVRDHVYRLMREIFPELPES
ncbi:MAG: cytidylate kinase [Patescibacteria group bacterium]|jgi:cytidylate kinase|nr:cytidylate kinase [Patescibacteria group bacterium]